MMTTMVTLTLITMKILEMNSINPNFIVFPIIVGTFLSPEQAKNKNNV